MKVHKEFVELDDEVKKLEGNPGRYFQHCMSLYHKLKDESYLQASASINLLLDNLNKPGKVMTDPDCPLTQKGYTKLLGMLEDLKEPYKVYKDKLNDIYQMLDYFFLTGERELKERELEKRNKFTNDEEFSKSETLVQRLKNLEKR